MLPLKGRMEDIIGGTGGKVLRRIRIIFGREVPIETTRSGIDAALWDIKEKFHCMLYQPFMAGARECLFSHAMEGI